ncbi:MAG: aldose epimerase [Alkalinema sp. CACIAM 70d]|nr:MAG: aldose epimerase [Alkalinema sp. CACIAM 70d]
MTAFSVEHLQQQYLTYRLQDETAQASIEVVPDRGGIITRWQIQDRELLYLNQERFQDPSLSIRGGIPILFPICGNLPNNSYTLGDRTYNLKQHGFARDLPWQVVSQSATDCASLTLALSSNAQTYEVYPFDFHLEFTYRVLGNRLTIDQQYTNRSQTPMPFSTGFHPYFNVQDKSQLRFDLPASSAIDQKTQQALPFFNTFDFAQPEIDWAFPDLSRTVAIATDLQTHLRLTLTYSPVFSTLVFWTLQDQDFYCLEPWSAPRNALNTGDRLMTLAPGETRSLQIELIADWV